MFKRGFALPTVISLMGLVGLLVTSGLIISENAFKSTSASAKFQLAEEASDSCLMRAMDEVNATGVCGARDLTNRDLGLDFGYGANCTVRLRTSGNICFIRSEGRMENSRVLKSVIIQIGGARIGLYSVRGNVNFTNSGGLLNGCHYETNNNCFISGVFTTSGNFAVSTQSDCPSTPSNLSPGLFGRPPITQNSGTRDFTSLVFAGGDCFSSNFYRSDERCQNGLLQLLRSAYSLNISRTWNVIPDMDFSPYGEPLTDAELMRRLISTSDVDPGTSSSVCRIRIDTTVKNSNPITELNLSQIWNNNDLLARLSWYASCSILELYTNRDLTLTGTFSDVRNRQVVIYMRRDTLDSPPPVLTLQNVTGLISSTLANGHEHVYNVRIYAAGPVHIRGNTEQIRIFTTHTIRVLSGDRIRHSTIIQSLESETQNNNPDSPQNFIVGHDGTGTLEIFNSKLFTRQIRFGTLRAYRSLIYLYANACPQCSRQTIDDSISACQNDARRCGWARGTGSDGAGGGVAPMENNAYVGLLTNRNVQNENGQFLASLIINNNSTLRGNQNFIGGLYFGQDINHVVSASNTVLRGLYISNFPPGLTVNLTFNSSHDFRFDRRVIETLLNPSFSYSDRYLGYKFVRRPDCTQETPTPAYMSTITKMTSW